jgi:cytochrome c-type biogenesis protein CcmH/NrfG
MARGATQAQRKRQPEPQKKRKKNATPAWEEQLFFSRLRTHAKVAYVFLAVVFAAGFVFLGVGSGSNGITDALQSFFGKSSGSSLSSQISDKQKVVERNPKDVNAYLDLAGVQQADQRESDALATLQKARAVAPNNVDVLNRIAAIYGAQAGREGDNYTAVLASINENAITPPGLNTSSPIGQALTSDPYSQALQTRLSEAYTKVTGAYGKVASTYKQAALAARGTAEEPNELLQWASASQNANDVTGAITAYTKFLKVAPTNPNAATVRQTLAQLTASAGQSHG